MIQEKRDIRIVKSADFKETSFGISEGNLAHIFGILRNSLYSDKGLALIREYMCNAYDSHVAANTTNTPIDVFAPNSLNQNFRVRDYGTGLSEDEIIEIFSKYGESTKRATNTQVGFMGIGSKSAFCYSDSFTITSWKNGVKSVYCAYIDETQVGKIAEVSKEQSDAKSGLEITIPIRSQDISNFNTKLKSFCKYFIPTPNLVGATPIVEDKVSYTNRDRTFLLGTNDYSNTIIMMGNVPYTITRSALQGWDSVSSNFYTGTKLIYFSIGELDIAANRETLQYTPKTIRALKQRAYKELEEVKEYIESHISSCKNLMEAINLFNELKDLQHLARLSGICDTIYWKGKIVTNKVNVKDFPGLSVKCLRDTGHTKKTLVVSDRDYFQFNKNEIIFYQDEIQYTDKMKQWISKNATYRDTYLINFDKEENYDKFISEFGPLSLTKLSEIVFEKEVKPKLPKNPKNSHKFFTLKNTDSSSLSDYWDEKLIDLNEEKNCVYVPIFKYEARIDYTGLENGYSIVEPKTLREVIKCLKDMGCPNLDVIYGVKAAFIDKIPEDWINLSKLVEQYLNSVHIDVVNNFYRKTIYKNTAMQVYKQALKPFSLDNKFPDSYVGYQKKRLASDHVITNTFNLVKDCLSPINDKETVSLNAFLKLLNIPNTIFFNNRKDVTTDYKLSQLNIILDDKYPLLKHLSFGPNTKDLYEKSVDYILERDMILSKRNEGKEYVSIPSNSK